MKEYKYIIGALILGLILGYGVFALIGSGNKLNEIHAHGNVTSNAESGKEEIWTCSMHPQIRQNEFGLCPICEMDLIILDNSMGNDDPTVLKMSKEAVKLAQIETIIIGESSNNSANIGMSSSINVDGTIEMDERTIKSQTIHLGGRIDDMNVNFEGEYVKAGQKIATIYSTELLAASQELITAAQYNNRVEGLKDAAIQKLKNWKISDSQVERILSSGQPIETINVYADHSGYILKKMKNQGEYVRQGDALYTIGNTGRLWLVFNVFESDMAGINIGDRVLFKTPSTGDKEFKARVTYINPLLNPNTRTAIVRAEVTNSGNVLKPGMLLTGRINKSKKSSKSKKSNTINVPNTAVLWTGERSVVYIQKPDTEIPSYEFREVVISTSNGKWTSISEGVELGEIIVVHGAFVIDAAAQLNNTASMMNRNVTKKTENGMEELVSFVDVTPNEFKEQLEELTVSYLNLKNGLINTDALDAKKGAESFLVALDKVKMELLKGDAHLSWMKYLVGLKAHGEGIKKAADVEKQRIQFDFLSEAIIGALRSFGTIGKIYYVQHCPMAFGNKGANWISSEEQIKNPYFGDKMMKCGIIKLKLD
ncbi:MAG: efflux RND transporter periplasmic adaptor subunit [Saprospiraceae bacterium]